MLQAILGPIAAIGRTWVEGKVAKSKARAEAEAQVLVQASQSTADWEAYMAKQAGQSWKDEWLTLLFSIPLIFAFVPSAVPYVMQGFAALEAMPAWYQYTLSIIVAASFGVRSAIGLMNKRGPK